MSRKVISCLPILAALVFASCSSGSDVAKLERDLEAVQKEAAEAKSLAENVSAEVGKDKADAEAAKLAAAQAEADMEAARVKLKQDMDEVAYFAHSVHPFRHSVHQSERSDAGSLTFFHSGRLAVKRSPLFPH